MPPAPGRSAVVSHPWTPGVVAAAVAVVELVALVPVWAESVSLALTNLLASVTFLAVGVVLSGDRQQRANARLFLATAGVWAVGDLGSWGVGPFPVLQYVAPPVGFATLALVVLRYPESVLPDRVARTLVVAVATVPVTIRGAAVLVSTAPDHAYPPGAWWPTVAELPAAATVLRVAYPTSSAVLVVGFVAVALAGFRHSTGIDRRLRAPVAVTAAAAAAVVLCETLARFLPQSDEVVAVVLSVEAAALLAVPVAFLVSAIRRRLARVAVADLVVTLSGPVSMEGLRAALRTSLSDPDLEITYGDSIGGDKGLCTSSVECACGCILARW